MAAISFTSTEFLEFNEMIKGMTNKQRGTAFEKILRLVESDSANANDIIKIISKKSNNKQKKTTKTCWHVFLAEMRQKSPGINQKILLQNAKPIWADMSEQEKDSYRKKADEYNAKNKPIESDVEIDSEVSENSDNDDIKSKNDSDVDPDVDNDVDSDVKPKKKSQKQKKTSTKKKKAKQ